ncbi:MAG: NmrA family NAD(P)-binding protein [Anaerolineae bacterium]|nr:NmrA family NAD(P)-binding protein [Anaerolineae bacterium]
MTTQNLILITGGTGKTGRRIVQRLQQQNIPVRIGSRSANPPFDWENEATWTPALKDVLTAYIAYQPDIAIPGAVDTIQKFVDKAVASGVQRLVLLSGRGEPEAQLCETIVAKSGVAWTVVSASFFAQNFSEGFVLESIQSGEVVLPTTTMAEPFIDVDDIADVATAALIEDGHSGKIYEVTGPRLLTFKEAVEEISRAVGRQIQYVSVPVEAYTQGAKDVGVPDAIVWLMEYLFTTVMDGRNAYLGDGVQQALGRKARDFSEYVQQVAQTGIWNNS